MLILVELGLELGVEMLTPGVGNIIYMRHAVSRN